MTKPQRNYKADAEQIRDVFFATLNAILPSPESDIEPRYVGFTELDLLDNVLPDADMFLMFTQEADHVDWEKGLGKIIGAAEGLRLSQIRFLRQRKIYIFNRLIRIDEGVQHSGKDWSDLVNRAKKSVNPLLAHMEMLESSWDFNSLGRLYLQALKTLDCCETEFQTRMHNLEVERVEAALRQAAAERESNARANAPLKSLLDRLRTSVQPHGPDNSPAHTA